MLSNKMNVLYLISCFGHGRGGHFYSLRTTATELSKEVNVKIVSVGTSVSPVLNGLFNYTAIKSNWPSPEVFSKIVKIVREQNIHVIHSFDSSSYLFARIVSQMTGVRVVHTKCGGPSPRRYFPKIKDLVLFSTEDMRYFRSSPKYKKTNLYHIPNRVNVVSPDNDAIQQLKKRLRPNSRVVLRIARFSEGHKKSILGSMELVQRLRQDQVDVQLVLVGAVQEKKVYEEIKSRVTPNVVLATDDIFTVNASRLLNVADVVVGTGRGAMEAALEGKVLLAPVKNISMPIIVTRENVDKFLEFNFSQRTCIENTTNENEYGKIRNLFVDKNNMKNINDFILKYAKENFDISEVTDRYVSIYKECIKSKVCLFDIAFHYFFITRSYLNAKKN